MSESTRVKYDRVREQITLMHQVVSSMLGIAQNMETRSAALADDMKRFAANLKYVHDTSIIVVAWHTCNIVSLSLSLSLSVPCPLTHSS